MLQEALISKFTARNIFDIAKFSKNAISSAVKRGKKGQLALLGKLPDFTIGEKYSENQKVPILNSIKLIQKQQLMKQLKPSVTMGKCK